MPPPHHMPHAVAHIDVAARLRDAGIQPTRQRVAIAQVLLHGPVHLTAEEILLAARTHQPSISRATVYNTLLVFVQQGLLRVLRLGHECTVYDSRTDTHSHLYHQDTGMVEDLPPEALQGPNLPAISPDLELLGLEVIVRVRQRPQATRH